MAEILEKADFFQFEDRLMAYIEMATKEPMKEWFTRDDLAQLRHCSASELYKNPDLLPNYGIPEDRWGKGPVWSRETVKKWLAQTRQELRALSDDRTPDEIERDEYLRAAASVKGNQIRLVK